MAKIQGMVLAVVGAPPERCREKLEKAFDIGRYCYIMGVWPWQPNNQITKQPAKVMNLMARKVTGPTKIEKYPYPSRYGSHKCMVIRESYDAVLCKDEHGEYFTEKNRLDNGKADPNRYRESRLNFSKLGG